MPHNGHTWLTHSSRSCGIHVAEALTAFARVAVDQIRAVGIGRTVDQFGEEAFVGNYTVCVHRAHTKPTRARTAVLIACVVRWTITLGLPVQQSAHFEQLFVARITVLYLAFRRRRRRTLFAHTARSCLDVWRFVNKAFVASTCKSVG
jgi:hypothetical protein